MRVPFALTTTRLAELSGHGSCDHFPCSDRLYSPGDVMVTHTLEYAVDCSIVSTELPLSERQASSGHR
jgi:hypothetical protein